MKREICLSILISLGIQPVIAQGGGSNVNSAVDQIAKPKVNTSLPGARLPGGRLPGVTNTSNGGPVNAGNGQNTGVGGNVGSVGLNSNMGTSVRPAVGQGGAASQTILEPGRGALGDVSAGALNRELNQIEGLRQQGIKDGSLAGFEAALKLEEQRLDSQYAQQEAADALDGAPVPQGPTEEQRAQAEAGYQQALLEQQTKQSNEKGETEAHTPGHTQGSRDSSAGGGGESGGTSGSGNGTGTGSGTAGGVDGSGSNGGSGSIFQDPTKGSAGGGISQFTDRASDLIQNGSTGNLIENVAGGGLNRAFGRNINVNENVGVRSLQGEGGASFKNGSPFAPGGRFSGVAPTGVGVSGINLPGRLNIPAINGKVGAGIVSPRDPASVTGVKVPLSDRVNTLPGVGKVGLPNLGGGATLQRLPGVPSGGTGFAAGLGANRIPTAGTVKLNLGGSINTRTGGAFVQPIPRAQRTEQTSKPNNVLPTRR